MSYPTLEQYNEAIQHPKTAFFDPELKSGTVSTTGLGLPLALCGGFALTYCIKNGNKKHAVRCFHKKSNNIELRYEAISNKIKSIQSPYFVNFEFQHIGINVNGKKAPIVKMVWATGETLGEFLENNYKNKDKLQYLNSSLVAIASFLEGKGIAHGDIQPGNVMVANEGKSIQLIDYDGMYVDEIKSLGSENDGLRNFQHPQRDKRAWNAKLDRFSFIGLYLALRILESSPRFWNETKSDGDSILFRANDFIDPGNSQLFSKLFGIKQFFDDARNFAAICQAPFDKIPTLESFITKINIPQTTISVSPRDTQKIQQYISAFPVLYADDYELCLKHVGDRVELIGRIVEIKHDKTRYGKPYVFINFGPWKGKTVKISIWSDGLATISHKPDSSWEGKWVTVTGLMEPPYHNKRYGYTHLSVTVTHANQLHILQEKDARYRLGRYLSMSETQTDQAHILKEPKANYGLSNSIHTIDVNRSHPASSNREVLIRIKGSSISQTTRQVNKPISKNQAILQTMKQQQGQYQQTPPLQSPPKIPPRQSPAVGNKKYCFIASAVYGSSAREINILREWRDDKLLLYFPGQMLANFYYFISPPLSKLIGRHETLKKITRILLDHFIAWISR